MASGQGQPPSTGCSESVLTGSHSVVMTATESFPLDSLSSADAAAVSDDSMIDGLRLPLFDICHGGQGRGLRKF